MREEAGACGAPAIAAADQRFFIVTAARTGSSLLSAILADAGAAFGMPIPQRWDRTGGALEHPQLWRALGYFRAADAISTGRPRVGIGRMRWNAYRSLGKRWLRAGLREAHFAKVYGAHDLVRPAVKIGYFPVVLLSYRRFEDQALSFGLMHAHATWELLCENYRHIYRNGLWLLNTFGGCVVSYERLVDRDDRSWAEPLARVTGLPREELIAARDGRITESFAPITTLPADPAADGLFATMDALSGLAIAPSHQALRAWDGLRLRDRHGAGPRARARLAAVPRFMGSAAPHLREF